jgi:hypothetical protein
MSVQGERFKEISDKIREKLGTDDLIKPLEFVTKIDKIYQKANEIGYGDGYKEGAEFGLQQQRRNFFDSYQDNGNRIDYEDAFAGVGWTSENFTPTHEIIVGENSSGRRMFYKSKNLNIDLCALLRNIASGSGFSFGYGSDIEEAFAYSGITKLPHINVSVSEGPPINAVRLCYGCKNLREIEHITFGHRYIYDGPDFDMQLIPDTGYYLDMLRGCTSLSNLSCSGEYADPIFDVGDCPLSKLSAQSVFRVLANIPITSSKEIQLVINEDGTRFKIPDGTKVNIGDTLIIPLDTYLIARDNIRRALRGGACFFTAVIGGQTINPFLVDKPHFRSNQNEDLAEGRFTITEAGEYTGWVQFWGKPEWKTTNGDMFMDTFTVSTKHIVIISNTTQKLCSIEDIAIATQKGWTVGVR